jgi:DNA/RNA-binding protein KIN17
MNSTQWETLTDFVKWLGRDGKCVVDETEKGWYVQYIDRDPETIAMQEALARKEKMDRDDQEKMMEFIEKQIEKGKMYSKNYSDSVFSEFVRPSEEDKVVINLKLGTKRTEVVKNETLVACNALKNGYKGAECSSAGNKNRGLKECRRDRGVKRKISALEEIMNDEENKKDCMNRKDYWLEEGIVVKAMIKSLGDKYYKKKGVVTGVPDKYVGTVSMLDSGHKLKLDQAHLETVIPAIGRPVLVVNGAYRGCSAILKELNEKKFCVTIEISSGPSKGRRVDEVDYGDICKLHNVAV